MTKRYYMVWQASYPGLKLLHFYSNRNAAIMWLKRYGKEFVTYRLNDKTVRVTNGYVWFYSEECGLMISAESKRTCQFATRNN